MRRLLALTVCAAALPACREGGGASEPGAVPPTVLVDPSSASATDRAIGAAQRALQARPDDPEAVLALAQAFLQKARETADPSLYSRAGELLDGLEGGAGEQEPLRLVLAGNLALTRHEFERALELGRASLALAPGGEGGYGVVVDALNELGRYDEALAETQAMVDLRPGLAGLSRVSYARELRGDLRGAATAMGQAIAAGGPAAGENVAYLHVIVGDLLLQLGDVAGAEGAYGRADAAFAGFAPARVGRARALVARGDAASAVTVLQEAVDIQPLPETAAALGEARGASGDPAGAAESYALVDAIASLQRANGVVLDLELALFEADHDGGDDAVALARAAAAARPSVYGWDALSWALFRSGDLAGAAEASARAVALGTATPALRFHAAAIAEARGDRVGATTHLRVVLDGNPRFSARIFPEVEALAARLGLVVPPPLGS